MPVIQAFLTRCTINKLFAWQAGQVFLFGSTPRLIRPPVICVWEGRGRGRCSLRCGHRQPCFEFFLSNINPIHSNHSAPRPPPPPTFASCLSLLGSPRWLLSFAFASPIPPFLPSQPILLTLTFDPPLGPSSAWHFEVLCSKPRYFDLPYSFTHIYNPLTLVENPPKNIISFVSHHTDIISSISVSGQSHLLSNQLKTPSAVDYA